MDRRPAAWLIGFWFTKPCGRWRGLAEPAWPLAEKFDRVREAGFDGMAIDLGALTLNEAEATVPHFARTGLAGGLTAFPNSIEALRPALALAHRIAAPFVVVIGQVMPIPVNDMVPVIEGWLRVAEQEGMPIQFETHRNCITNDLFTTVQLLDAIPEMRLAADLSHYVVDREMPCPPPASLRALVTKILERSDSFQGRGRGARSDSDCAGFSAECQMGRPCSGIGGARASPRGGAGIAAAVPGPFSSASWDRPTMQSRARTAANCRIAGAKRYCWRTGHGNSGRLRPATADKGDIPTDDASPVLQGQRGRRGIISARLSRAGRPPAWVRS